MRTPPTPRAQKALYAEVRRHERGTGGSHWLGLLQDVLEPDEAVLAGVVGSTSDSNEPALLVTDRRVLLAKPRLLGRWAIKGEIPAADVADAEVARTLLAQKVRVRGRIGTSLQLTTVEKDHAERLVELVRHLVAGGAPPL